MDGSADLRYYVCLNPLSSTYFPFHLPISPFIYPPIFIEWMAAQTSGIAGCLFPISYGRKSADCTKHENHVIFLFFCPLFSAI